MVALILGFCIQPGQSEVSYVRSRNRTAPSAIPAEMPSSSRVYLAAATHAASFHTMMLTGWRPSVAILRDLSRISELAGYIFSKATAQ